MAAGNLNQEEWRPLFPGWALEPAGWRDRQSRRGWATRYTTVGAAPSGYRFPSTDPRLAYGLASVLVAGPRSSHELSSDTAYWVTVARRLLQRGTLPPVGEPGEAEVSEGLLWALFPPVDHELEPTLDLHPTFEEPFFRIAAARFPEQAQFLIPQAPLESAGNGSATDTTRWIDFLLSCPGSPTSALEIDGDHRTRLADDAQRDQALNENGIVVYRADGPTALGRDSPVISALAASMPTECAPAEAIRWRDTLRSARIGYGIIEAVAVGLLKPAVAVWNLSLTGGIGNPEVLSSVIAAIGALDALWSTGVMPAEITVEGETNPIWCRPKSSAPSAGESSASIICDFAPTWAALPHSDGSRREVVVRGVPLPSHAGWDQPLSGERRPLADGAPALDALETLSSFAFGIASFRSGQVEAVRRVLGQGDCCVLLPTGHGKTLVYQLAMLTQPGLTMVIAPITSLIDDQESRFLDVGIDRVAALHASRATDDRSRDQLHHSVAKGNALVALLSPERLQIQRFRDSLSQAVQTGTVSMAVVDEAHCVSEWGHDFRTSYLRLGRNLRRLCSSDDDVPPTLLAMTGTASPRVLSDVLRELGIDRNEPGALQRPDEFDRPNLHYSVNRGGEKESFDLLRKAILEDIPSALGVEPAALTELLGPDTASGIVFVPWAKGAYGTIKVKEKIEGFFKDAGLPTPAIGTYSGRNPAADNDGIDSSYAVQKSRTAAQFKNNELAILVATKAFGMGVDKPNIRWTAHVGFPSSIEAFAQEAGRAGRDRRSAQCVISTGQITEPQAQRLLALNDTYGTRKSTYESLDESRVRDDLMRQLFFLYNSFPGNEADIDAEGGFSMALGKTWVHGEVAQARGTWGDLREGGAHQYGELTITRLPNPAQTRRLASDYRGTLRGLRDKALYRLSLLGVIDDLTIDYGADTATVHFGSFSVQSLDTHLLDAADRIQPGQHQRHLARITAAPDDLDPRINSHLEYLIDLVYEVIEPARINALREMWRLTLGKPDDERIRRTIVAYLGDGATATTLEGIATSQVIDVQAALSQLDLNPPADVYEHSGAAARQLDAFPGHPMLLAVRALGEAHLPTGAPEEFTGFIRALLQAQDQYGLSTTDLGRLFDWLRRHLYNDWKGERRDWARYLWATFASIDGCAEILDDRVPTALSDSRAHPAELESVLAWRLSRTSALLRQIPSLERQL
jgi:ATP-dependent DNA helicase RecQ